jgi:hypothetical protein
MTHIDTNDHDLVLTHEFWHSHLDGCASNLGVDLLHDVRCYGEVHLSCSELEHHLTQNVVARNELLDLGVVMRLVEDEDGKELLLSLLKTLDSSQDGLLILVEVSEIWNLTELKASSMKLHLLLAALTVLEGILSLVGAVPVMENEDSGLLKIRARVDGDGLEISLVGIDLLTTKVLMIQLWCCQSSTLQELRLLVDLDVPFSPLAHAEQLLKHGLD